jgi:mRNA interferase MazF
VLTMITTAKAVKWPLDVPIRHPGKAGLPEHSFVRMKLFTLDNRLILKSLGSLSEPDRSKVGEALDVLLAY